MAIDPTSTLPTIGASGAIAGMMGAYFVLYPQSRVLTLIPWIFIQVVEVPAIVLLGFWFLMQLFSAGAIAVTASNGGSGGSGVCGARRRFRCRHGRRVQSSRNDRSTRGIALSITNVALTRVVATSRRTRCRSDRFT